MKAPMRIKIKLALLVGDLVLLALCLAVGTYIRRRRLELCSMRQYSTAWFSA